VSPSLINSAATCRAVACLLTELEEEEEEDPAGGFGLPADFPASTAGVLFFRCRPHSSCPLIPCSISLSVDGVLVHITDFIANSRARHQKDRDAKAEALKIMGRSSSSLAHASAEEHTLSNERKRKELQDLQGGAITGEYREEWKAMNLKAA
jgi:hypothetical protein